jgi:hypothetical protein
LIIFSKFFSSKGARVFLKFSSTEIYDSEMGGICLTQSAILFKNLYSDDKISNIIKNVKHATSLQEL